MAVIVHGKPRIFRDPGWHSLEVWRCADGHGSAFALTPGEAYARWKVELNLRGYTLASDVGRARHADFIHDLNLVLGAPPGTAVPVPVPWRSWLARRWPILLAATALLLLSLAQALVLCR